MKAEQIRAWASKAHRDINLSANEASLARSEKILQGAAIDVQIGQMLMLAEIAAQLAQANKLKVFELGLDPEGASDD